MTVTREELAAFADGELDPAREAEVAAVVAADPELAAQVESHRALRARLAGHFAPVFEAPVPDRLASLLRPEPQIVDFAAAREKRERARALPRWTWIAGPALAASLALAVFWPRGGYVDAPLADTLDNQLVARQAADADRAASLRGNFTRGLLCQGVGTGRTRGRPPRIGT